MKYLIVFALIFVLSLTCLAGSDNYNASLIEKIPGNMYLYLAQTGSGVTTPAWVFFTDRGLTDEQMEAALAEARSTMPERTLKRRIKGGNPDLNEKDLPVNTEYISQVEASGAELRTVTRYFNGISVNLTFEQASVIAELPFVDRLQLVARGNRTVPFVKGETGNREVDYNYGESWGQLNQINVPVMHNRGFTGAGVLVCLLDTGFRLNHLAFANMDVIAQWDFINGDSVVANEPGDPDDQHNHGTMTLSTIGGMVEGELYGPAFGATYMVGKTEKTDEEIPIEEDYYVEGLEWADSLGADVISTSLGYYDWYEFEDMDGNTCVTTVAVDITVANGIVCVSSAGNERNSNWGHIIAPADADSVISTAAVDIEGDLASFSSPGPSYDGRIKPEVSAMGVDVHMASPWNLNGFTEASGTSFSCPLTAGVAALVVQAHPNWEPMMVREALMMTASQASTPDNDFGWGIIDALAAVMYSYPPEIEYRFPEQDSVIVALDSTQIFEVDATDPDNDPLLYSLVVNDSVWFENDSGYFEVSFEEADTLTIQVIVEDLIGFADTTNWTVFTEGSAFAEGNANLVPGDFAFTVYPNPFNSSAKLSYYLPDAGNVEITVFDLQGREVVRLLNGYQESGNHEIKFAAGDLASGLYLARLESRGYNSTRKLLFIK